MTEGGSGVTGGPWPGNEAELLQALLEVYRWLELDAQVRALAATAQRWTDAREVHGWALDPEEPTLFPVSPQESTAPSRRRGALRLPPVQEAFAGQASRGPGPRPEFLARPVAEPCWLWAVRGPEDALVGLVVLGGVDLRAHPATQRLAALFERARPAVGHALLWRATQQLVIKDDTADCFNRRYFNEFLQSEMARAARFRSPLSLIFFDLDDLKSVNSRYGHATGSKVLLEVSRRVLSRIRRFDKLFRFGGDEFCIVLPETEWHGALEVGERVREAIGSVPMLRAELGGQGLPMSASFGIASFPLHARGLRELIERADWAMQEAKSRGKNSIAVAEVVPDRPAEPEARPVGAKGRSVAGDEGGEDGST